MTSSIGWAEATSKASPSLFRCPRSPAYRGPLLPSGGDPGYLSAVMLVVFALLLAVADRWGSKRNALEQLTWRHGVLFGLAQALTMIPGVSRLLAQAGALSAH